MSEFEIIRNGILKEIEALKKSNRTAYTSNTYYKMGFDTVATGIIAELARLENRLENPIEYSDLYIEGVQNEKR